MYRTVGQLKRCSGSLLKHLSIQKWRGQSTLLLSRTLYSHNQQWEPEFNSDVRRDIETYWKDKLRIFDKQNEFNQEDDSGSKQYVLSMFPYPSGALHMGHVRVYTISDLMARYYRLKGHSVLHPMGWDAFGLPAENAAIDRGEQPETWTDRNIDNMRTQLEDLCLSFDWNREYRTCDPSYYKWTQYIFLKMHEAGLVYQKEAPVNWDPVDQTVLADEQIDEEGRSWRSGAVAEKRLLRQWYIKTTDYSQSLFEGLDEVNPDLWRDVVELQKYWIGQCDGIRLEFKVKIKGSFNEEKLSLFTKTPEGVYGASHILLSSQHPIISSHNLDKKECRLDVEAVNPFTGQHIPVFYTEDFDFGDHLDSHIGIPSLSQADAEFAQKYNLQFNDVIVTDEDGTQRVTNSGEFSGLGRREAFDKIAEHAKKLGCGGQVTSERGRDWLISRQRYWGTPIPIIHCQSCGAVPVPMEDLPVTLPKLEKITGKGLSPLKEALHWQKVQCPKCGGEGYRETDTMDTFVDSSWYFLRYCDTHNARQPFSRDAVRTLMPVDLYIGGKEHAIMHLYYARFFNHFLHDLDLVPCREPFINLLTQGMVMGQSYRLTDTGRYIHKDQVDFSRGVPVERETGAALTVEWEKMSKSKYNGVDPQAVLEEFGTDSTRLCILSNVAPKTDRNWDPRDMVGILRWQSRMWNLITMLHQAHALDQPVNLSNEEERKEWEDTLWQARNYTIKEVTWNVGRTFLLNVAISRLQAFTNTLLKVPADIAVGSEQFERALCELVVMVSPFAPMYASEMWAGLRGICRRTNFELENHVLNQSWPENDGNYHLHLKVKRGTKDCFHVPLPVPVGKEDDLSREDFLRLATSHPDYEGYLGDLNKERFQLRVQAGYKVTMTYILTKQQQKDLKVKKRKDKVKSVERS